MAASPLERSIEQAEPRLNETMTGPKQGTQSMWGVMPWPGVYSLTMS